VRRRKEGREVPGSGSKLLAYMQAGMAAPAPAAGQENVEPSAAKTNAAVVIAAPMPLATEKKKRCVTLLS